MASLRKRPGSNKWVCCYTLPDGTRTQKSTKQADRKAAMLLCLDWETTANRARNQDFTEAQARRVVSEICERAGLAWARTVAIQSKGLMTGVIGSS